MMKILFVLPRIYPYYIGGAEIFHYHFLNSIPNDHTVAYISFNRIIGSNRRFYRLFKVRPLKYLIPIQTIIGIVFFFRKFDVIHLNFCQSNITHWIYYPLLKKFFGLKYGMTIHDGSSNELNNKRLFRWVFKEAHFVVAVSERLKDKYELFCNRSVYYLPPLVPLQRSSINRMEILKTLSCSSDSYLILFAGSLKDLKRPQVVLEALNLLDKQWLDKFHIKILFAGDGILKEDLEHFAEINYLGKYCDFLGFVPQDSIKNLYEVSSLYIISSIYEGKSMSLIEAMFNKLPIISSNVLGLNDIIANEYNGLLFTVDDAVSLSECIKRCVENPRFASMLGANAYKDYINNFSFEMMLNSYISIYC